jgi:hypothetical protein
MSDVTLTATSGNINLNFGGGLYMANGGGSGYFTVDYNGFLYWCNTVSGSNNQLTFT